MWASELGEKWGLKRELEVKRVFSAEGIIGAKAQRVRPLLWLPHTEQSV